VLHRRLVPRHPPYATITWPLQITRCSRTLFTNQKTHHTPQHHTATKPYTQQDPHHGSSRSSGISESPHPPHQGKGCFLRHPTARPHQQPHRPPPGKSLIVLQ